MAGPIDIYYLVRLADPPAGLPPHLLLKVTQAEYPNWDQSQEDAAVIAVIRRRDRLIEDYCSLLATPAGGRPPAAEVVGEYQVLPVGAAFYEPADRPMLDVWVAPTRFGSYWLVLGAAATEEAFWHQVAADEDAAGLEPVRPAMLLTVCFLNRADRPKT